MENLLKIAKEILEIKSGASLTGTLMLKLRGIDLGREPKDIDILICDYAPNIKFPEGFEFESRGFASDGCGARYEHKGIIIDVLSDGEQPENVNGWSLGTVEKLIQAKFHYSKQNNESAEKHHNDLVKLGFIFPEPKDDFDLPF